MERQKKKKPDSKKYVNMSKITVKQLVFIRQLLELCFFRYKYEGWEKVLTLSFGKGNSRYPELISNLRWSIFGEDGEWKIFRHFDSFKTINDAKEKILPLMEKRENIPNASYFFWSATLKEVAGRDIKTGVDNLFKALTTYVEDLPPLIIWGDEKNRDYKVFFYNKKEKRFEKLSG